LRSRSKLVPVIVAAITLAGIPAAPAASILQNGEFEGSLVPWRVEGVAGNTGDTAVFSDSAGTRVAVFQTAAVPAGFAGFTLILDFIGFVSSTVSPGFVLDTFFATVYLGLDSFGATIAGGDFDQALDLFDLDANGVFNATAGATFGPSPKGAGWTRFSLTRTTAPGFTDPGFATVAFEFFDLNGIPADSVVAVDNVQLLAIVPEPGAVLFLGLAAVMLWPRRYRVGSAS